MRRGNTVYGWYDQRSENVIKQRLALEDLDKVLEWAWDTGVIKHVEDDFTTLNFVPPERLEVGSANEPFYVEVSQHKVDGSNLERDLHQPKRHGGQEVRTTNMTIIRLLLLPAPITSQLAYLHGE